jgi:hypothetical protein
VCSEPGCIQILYLSLFNVFCGGCLPLMPLPILAADSETFSTMATTPRHGDGDAAEEETVQNDIERRCWPSRDRGEASSTDDSWSVRWDESNNGA